jgi:hypothetical protein
MNRHSFPEEIDAPSLNSRGRYIHHGHDASTARQLAGIAGINPEIESLGELLDENHVMPVSEDLYVLTSDKYNGFVSSAVAHIGSTGLRVVYWLSSVEQSEFEADFNAVLDTQAAQQLAHYPEAS